MKKMLIFTLMFLIFLTSPSFSDQVSGRDISYGVGLGVLYGGLGANVAMVDDHDMKYLAGGLAAFAVKNSDEFKLAPGLAVGWLRTDIVAKESDKHGIGGFIGLAPGIGMPAKFWAGPSYTYFFNGLQEPGLNVGVSAGIDVTGDDTCFFLLPQIGYQF